APGRLVGIVRIAEGKWSTRHSRGRCVGDLDRNEVADVCVGPTSGAHRWGGSASPNWADRRCARRNDRWAENRYRYDRGPLRRRRGWLLDDYFCASTRTTGLGIGRVATVRRDPLVDPITDHAIGSRVGGDAASNRLPAHEHGLAAGC